MARSDANPLARIHALWTLEGLQLLDAALVREQLAAADPHVRRAAIRVSESLFKMGDTSLMKDVFALMADPDENVIIQAMMTADLLKWPEATARIQATANFSQVAGVREIGAQLLNPLSAQVSTQFVSEQRGVLERGQQIFMEMCSACHGVDGKGTPFQGGVAGLTLAPPLAGSPTVLAHRDGVINVLLHGLTGPVHGKTYGADMMSMGANDDEWVSSIASFIRTSFGNQASLVTPEDVSRVRSLSPDRTEHWTLDELQQQIPELLTNYAEWKFTTNLRAPDAEPASVTPSNVQLSFATRQPQEPGVWLQIELPEPAMLSAVRVECFKSPKNYPRSYQVELSLDGIEWSEPVAAGPGLGPVLEASFQPTAGRWVRITQTGAGRAMWVVDGVQLFTVSSPIAAMP